MLSDSSPESVPEPVLYVVSLTPEPGYEAKFNRWYDTIHVPELLACPGFRSVRRYHLVDGRDGSPQYFALYEVDSMAAFSGPRYEALHRRTPDDLEPLAREVRLHHTHDINAKYREIFRDSARRDEEPGCPAC